MARMGTGLGRSGFRGRVRVSIYTGGTPACCCRTTRTTSRASRGAGGLRRRVVIGTSSGRGRPHWGSRIQGPRLLLAPHGIPGSTGAGYSSIGVWEAEESRRTTAGRWRGTSGTTTGCLAGLEMRRRRSSRSLAAQVRPAVPTSYHMRRLESLSSRKADRDASSSRGRRSGSPRGAANRSISATAGSRRRRLGRARHGNR